MRSTLATPTPWSSYAAATEAFGLGASASIVSLYALLDPGGAAVLVARRGENRSDVYGLAPSEPVVPFHAAGEAYLPDPVSVARIGSRWFLLANGPGASLIVQRVDGDSVQTLARLPRLGRSDAPRLIHRVRSVGLGLLVNGATSLGNPVHDWSVLPLDPDTGGLGDPVRLVGSDLDGLPLRTCEADEDGWWVDAVPTSLPSLQIPRWPDVRLNSLELRMRLGSSSACVDAIAAHADGISTDGGGGTAGSTAGAVRLIASDRNKARRWELQCQASPPP